MHEGMFSKNMLAMNITRNEERIAFELSKLKYTADMHNSKKR